MSMSCRGNCHYNAVAESYSSYWSMRGKKKKLTERGNKSAASFLITPKCFITVSAGMILMLRGHRRIMKINIINGAEFSRLPVVIQGFISLTGT